MTFPFSQQLERAIPTLEPQNTTSRRYFLSTDRKLAMSERGKSREHVSILNVEDHAMSSNEYGGMGRWMEICHVVTLCLRISNFFWNEIVGEVWLYDG